MIKLVEIYYTEPYTYNLREVFINPEYVVSIQPEENLTRMLVEKTGKFPDGLDTRQQFTRIILDKGHTGLDIKVIGSPEIINERMNAHRRQILRG